MQKARRITVYCSSSDLIDSSYLSLGEELGMALAKAQFTLVYGGESHGIMARLAKGVIETGGKVIGIIPDPLIQDIETNYKETIDFIHATSLEERKYLLQENADAFVVLPGGLGTLDEMFETLVSKVLKISEKPLMLLNHKNFFGSLLNFLSHLDQENFIHGDLFSYLQVYTSTQTLVQSLREYFTTHL